MTPEGERLIEELIEVTVVSDARAMDGLSAAEVAALAKLVRTVLATVDRDTVAESRALAVAESRDSRPLARRRTRRG
jgi:hypothetical protein